MDFKISSSDSNLFQLFQDSPELIQNDNNRQVFYILFIFFNVSLYCRIK